MDMSQFIIAKSDQLNADDLAGGPITVKIERVTGNDSADQPVSVHYVGDEGKPFKPCKSMRRVMVFVWGLEAKEYAGKSMTLRRDPEVMFGGMKVGGIRITHMSGIDKEQSFALNVTRGKKGLYKVLPLTDAPVTRESTVDDVAQALQEAAKRGSQALEAAWKSKSTGPHREALLERLTGWKAEAAAVDEAAAQQKEEADDGYEGA